MLIDLGFAEDERVLAACENLLELKRTYGGFCDTLIRCGPQAQRAAQRKKGRKRRAKGQQDAPGNAGQ